MTGIFAMEWKVVLLEIVFLELLLFVTIKTNAQWILVPMS